MAFDDDTRRDPAAEDDVIQGNSPQGNTIGETPSQTPPQTEEQRQSKRSSRTQAYRDAMKKKAKQKTKDIAKNATKRVTKKVAIEGGKKALETGASAVIAAPTGELAEPVVEVGVKAAEIAALAELKLVKKGVGAIFDPQKIQYFYKDFKGELKKQKWLLWLVLIPVFSLVTIFMMTTGSVALQLSMQTDTNIASPSAQTNPPVQTGIEYPPNLGKCISVPAGVQKSARTTAGIPGEYCNMPPSLDGAYRTASRGEWRIWGPQTWGSKEMIGVLYTVARKWQTYYCSPEQIRLKTCRAQLRIHDITSPYHNHHFWGVSVDLTATTNGTDCVGTFAGGNCSKNYNGLATIRLGQLIIDTGYMHRMLHNGDTRAVTITDPNTLRKTTSTVNKEIYLYAQSKYPTRFTQRYRPDMVGVGVIHVAGHDNHIHLYIDRDQNSYASNGGAAFDRSKLLKCTLVKGIGCDR